MSRDRLQISLFDSGFTRSDATYDATSAGVDQEMHAAVRYAHT